MTGRNGQELLSAWVAEEIAESFKTLAREADGGTSAALRRLVVEAVAQTPILPPRGAGTGCQVGIRLKATERALLAKAAHMRGTSPANWLRSLALVHLSKRPQWNDAEMDALRNIAAELRRIGGNINQIARALNNAQLTGEYPTHQEVEVKEAAEMLRYETRRLAGIMTGNFDYWGLPDAERPSAAKGADARRDAEAKVAEAQRTRLPKRRKYQFDDE